MDEAFKMAACHGAENSTEGVLIGTYENFIFTEYLFYFFLFVYFYLILNI